MNRLWFATLFLVSQTVSAHTGRIVGKVLERQSKSPITGVNVVIDGLARGAVTDTSGQFAILGVPTGRHTIMASAIGYLKQSLSILLGDADSARVIFYLTVDVLNIEEVTITGHRTFSAASSDVLRAMDFELRPKQSAQDMLRLVPGLVIAQHAGGGKAEQIFLRGFDADHGTDINLSVDGVPVNMLSHGHGQGYADLHFLIPEVVKGIEVYKGPYFAQFGDLATAGSVRFLTRDALDYNVLSVEGGRFGTYRYLTMFQLPLQSNSTTAYAAAEFNHTDGYFDSPIAYNRYNIFAKVRGLSGDGGAVDFWASGFGSGWDATGQIPERAVAQGLIGRFGSLDYSEGGTTQRQNFNLTYTSVFQGQSTFLAQAYLFHYRFRLFSNFTFFAQDSINGDEIEQNDERTVLGARTEYTAEHRLGSMEATAMFGSTFRSDDIHPQLWHAVQRQRLEQRADAMIEQKNMSLYIQEDLCISSAIRLQLGLRGDYFLFDVEDGIRDSAHTDISGYVQQTILSPKVNLVISPNSDIDVFLNFGSGFHSNDARVVAAMPANQTLPKALGAEVGLRVTPANKLTLSVVAWGLDLESELVYVGDEGTTEPSGRTRRLGLDLEARAQLNSWLFVDADVNFSRGRFRDLPEGENRIPLAPIFTATGGVTARHPGGYDGSLRVRHIDDRPANENSTVTARGCTVFDATAGFAFSHYRLQLTAENLFNVSWNEAQFDTESRLSHEPEPVSELHFTPGTPFNLRMKIEYHF